MRNFYVILIIFIVSFSTFFNKVYGKALETDLDVGINFIQDIPLYQNNKIAAVVETPVGSRDIWKVNMKTGIISWDTTKGIPKKLDFSLGYPANLAFFPRTKAFPPYGNGKRPLYTFIIGSYLPTGSIILVEPVAILSLNENNKKSVILVSIVSNDTHVFSDLLQKKYSREIAVIKYWLENYKRDNEVEVSIDNDMNNILNVIKDSEALTE